MRMKSINRHPLSPSGTKNLKTGSPHQPDQQLDEPQDLPDSYGETKVVLLPVEPDRGYVYWEITKDDLKQAGSEIPDLAEQPEMVLRLTDSDKSSFDVTVDQESKSCYVDHLTPGQSYMAELGLKTADSKFLPISQSNKGETPKAAPSPEPEPPVPESTTGKDTARPYDFEQMDAQPCVTETKFHFDPESILFSNVKPEAKKPTHQDTGKFDVYSEPVEPGDGLDFLKRLIELYNIPEDIPVPIAPRTGAAALHPLTKREEIKYKNLKKMSRPDLVELCEAGFMSGVSSIINTEHMTEFEHDKRKR